MNDGNNVSKIEGKFKNLMFRGLKACIAKMIVSGLLHQVATFFFRNTVTHLLFNMV
jgi:hypothetical protein